jgi:hypothetical protein
MIESHTMPDIKEYASIQDAAADPKVPYSEHWLRVLCQRGEVEAVKMGTGQKSIWLVHMPSLHAYVARMEQEGTEKHTPKEYRED